MKLPPAQQDLLDDIAETSRGVLYVRHYGRYGRTVRALARRGLVEIVEPDPLDAADGRLVPDRRRPEPPRLAVGQVLTVGSDVGTMPT